MTGHSHAPGSEFAQARRYDARLWLRTRGRPGAFRREQVELARLAPGEAVLDLGCGTGALALAAKRGVGRQGVVRGIDPSEAMIARARRRARRARLDVGFEVGAAQELPFPDAGFDAVLATLVLHHLPPDDLDRCLGEVRRVLRPGGRLLAVDLGGPQHGTSGPHAHARWDLDELAPRLARAGLDEVAGGPVAFRLARFERLRWVLAEAV